jgi:hypothetical protein
MIAMSQRYPGGSLMLFTVTEDNWTNQDDELVKTSGSTLIRY